MALIQQAVEFINGYLWSYVLIILLLGLGLYFSIRSGFVQFRLFAEMFRVIKDDVSENKKGVSSFQAWTISTASRVGTGNMAGVALAIGVGGPGAIFWMWIVALIGGATSFVESTLAQVYKVKEGDAFRGGPSYYIERALNAKWMALLFSILITITYGLIFNAVQSNTITVAFKQSFHWNRLMFGIIILILTALIIFGGIKRIATFTGVIVPVMAIIYIAVAFYTLITHIAEIPDMISTIFSHAFGLQTMAGGTIGAMVMNGIKRGLFSNEAGMGSAPNAAATATVSHPAKQGLVQTLSVFTDTLLICSATAFMILISGEYLGEANGDGIALTQAAMNTLLGRWGSSFVAVSIFLFAFSSIIGNYYYGESNIQYYTKNKAFLNLYRLLVLAMGLFGAVTKVTLVWDLADLFMALMAIVNLVAIALLGNIAFAVLKDYIRQKKEGKDPLFQTSSIPSLRNVEWWGGSSDRRRS
ncbi:AGCS family alanine or glycine:cation symporter [Pullulanibacillus pueri]|uniref:Sodium:alanine symporter n=1 Tax=Pullulanibacillus pueri TaxID=1437324 RepID=A0A8J2ZZD2_9BACL|nr:alanine/glycine:cation symporter family protein [Pullulanibacillus pueri]MBM7682040.1 AGCS family alanine or glycine:cation symporter [Pullulanibacillus pueri]GGH88299.1 sodium:alanine symporter [Pullulanibacillus pueri]